MNKHIFFFRIAALATILVVCTLSLLPQPPQPFVFSGADLLEHFAAWALVSCLCALGFLTRPIKHSHSIGLLLVLILAGGLIEILQPYLGRHRDILDFFANTAGILLGYGVYALLTKPRKSPI